MKIFWSNCLFYACKQLFTEGGYIIIKRTRQRKFRSYGWWPHFFWSPNLKTFYEFKPTFFWDGWKIPPPIFKGYVRKMGKGEE